MKKVLLLDTSIATQNIGDEIINDSLRMNWKELYEENYICKFPTHTPPYSWWQQLLVPRKFERLSHSDYKFLCGTNALYTNMMRPLPQWNVYPWNALFFRNTVLVGVGAGINSKRVNFYTRLLYNKVLSKDYVHSTRDEYTKEMLISMGFRAVNTGCPTLWGLTEEYCTKIPTVKSKKVIFTLTGYQPDIDNDRLMIEILSKNYSEMYFWPQTPTDLDYLYELGDFDVKIVTPNLCAYDKILGNYDIDYVGNRLHGGIRALQYACRSLIISIDYRAMNMAEQYRLPVIKREEIKNKLDIFINSFYKTELRGINWDLISEWKNQFDF